MDRLTATSWRRAQQKYVLEMSPSPWKQLRCDVAALCGRPRSRRLQCPARLRGSTVTAPFDRGPGPRRLPSSAFAESGRLDYSTTQAERLRREPWVQRWSSACPLEQRSTPSLMVATGAVISRIPRMRSTWQTAMTHLRLYLQRPSDWCSGWSDFGSLALVAIGWAISLRSIGIARERLC